MAEKRRAHCWEDGPRDDEGRGSTCMLWDDHEGAHEWTPDSQIMVSFAPFDGAPQPTAERDTEAEA